MMMGSTTSTMQELDDRALMPPPPPRPPTKRRKTAAAPSSPDAAAGAAVVLPPDSISIPPPPLAPDEACFLPLQRSGSVSPDEPLGGDTERAVEVRVGAGYDDAPKHLAAAGQSRALPLDNDAPQDHRESAANDEPMHEVSADDSIPPPQGAKGKPPSPRADVSFHDIIGHGPAKLRLDEALLPLALPPDLAASVLTGIRAAPASILLHGPPGCGKSKLAQAVAGEAGAAFLSVGPSDVLSKFVGESEASIRGLFRDARSKARERESRCAVVFFDEIDALGRSRADEDTGKTSQAGGDNSSRRVLAELLIQMTELSNDTGEIEEEEGEEYGGYGDDGDSCGRSTISTGPGLLPMSPAGQPTEQQVDRTPTRAGGENGNANTPQPKPRVIVVAATNRPEDCDPALLRRFAVRVLVGLPSRKDRKRIIKRLLSDVEHNLTSAQLDALALETEGWSGSDLESMTREAVMAPVRECLRAAAITKRKAGTHDHATRESLLNGFRNLRPVSSKDFEDGIAFFLGDQQGSTVAGLMGHSPGKHAHYDSSSEEEDGED